MARFNAAFEKGGAISHVENERNPSKVKRVATAVLAATGVSVAAVFNMAPANADEIVIVPGMGDTNGQGYENQLRATGQIGPNDTVYKVPYSAAIFGPIGMEQSVNESVVNGRIALDEAMRNAAPGERVVIRGYSEGGTGASRLANERSGGGPVAPGTVIIDGAPVSSTSIFENQDPLLRTFMPLVTDMLQIPTGDRAPAGSILRHSQQDVWANGAGSDLGRLISQGMDTFMGPAHAVQNPSAPHNVWVGPDGIVHHEFPGVGTGGIPPNAITMGGPGAVLPPAPVPEARPAPNSPNFRAVSRDWKERHGMELNGTSHNAPTQNNRPTRNNLPQSTYGSRSVTLNNGTRADGTTRTSRVQSHTSLRFEPTTRAPRFGNRNDK